MSVTRILVVEDNPLVSKFYRLALERAGGFTVTCSEDVDEILRRVAQSEFDAVILDVSLRNCQFDGGPIDGLALARLIREIPQGKTLPILLATAHAMEGDRERLLTASGADAYIEKPIYKAQFLIDKIQDLIARRS